MEPVDVGTRPAALAVAKEGIFVAERQGVTLIDPRTNAESGAVTTVTTGGPTPENAPFSIAVTRDRLWMARRDGFLVSIDRRTRELVGKPVRYGTGAGTVTTAAGSVWVNNFHDAHAGSLARVNPCTGAVTRVKVGREANSVVPGFGSLWVTDSVDSALKRIDPVTGSVVASIGGLDDPQDVLPAFGRVWVAEYDKKALREIDPRTNRIVGRRIPIGSDPAAIAAGAGALWIPLYGNGSITRVDPHTRRSRLGAASAGTSPTDTVVAFGRLWAPNNDGDTVTPVRIP
jgi:streptogramin lyase